VGGANRVADGPEPKEVDLAAAQLSLGRVPTMSEQLKNSIGERISKLCGDSDWQSRFIAITRHFLVISHDGARHVSDQIPLYEVTSCARLPTQSDVSSHRIAFVVETIHGGYNGGRQYIFSVENEDQFLSWTQAILKQAAISAKQYRNLSIVEQLKERAADLLRKETWQFTFSFLIVANFIVNICQSSAAPSSEASVNSTDANSTVFYTFDLIFTALFAIELFIGFFANWFTPFFRSGWNCFDLVVVALSIFSVCYPDGPTWIIVLRTMRLFRIVRLFRRLRVLRTIVSAVLAALPIVANGFVLLGLVAIVFAVVGQALFSRRSPALFGTFKLSLYSIFGVLTINEWRHKVAAVKAPEYGVYDVDPTPACFFVSLIVICSWILIQVVSAVLVDNFTRACRREERQALIDEENEHLKARGLTKVVTKSPIAPLLDSLALFHNSVMTSLLMTYN